MFLYFLNKKFIQYTFVKQIKTSNKVKTKMFVCFFIILSFKKKAINLFI